MTITKDDTKCLKGIALLMMFMLHLFLHPEWILLGISTIAAPNELDKFRKPLGSCVSIFAFVTGWGYACKKNPSFDYSAKKIMVFLRDYWIVYAALLMIALLTKTYRGGVLDVLLEMFALKRPVMWFCWYVEFYILCMLLFPFAVRLMNKKLSFAVVASLIITGSIWVSGKVLPDVTGVHYLKQILQDSRFYFLIVSSGYICCRYQLFHKSYNMRVERLSRCFQVLVCLGLIVVCMAFQNLGSIVLLGNMVVIPILIFSLVNLIHILRNKRIWSSIFRVLRIIGTHSMNMWFLHGIFFNCSRELFQPLAYPFPHWFLNYLWVLVICLVTSVLIEQAKSKLGCSKEVECKVLLKDRKSR